MSLRKILVLFGLLTATATISAQNVIHRGIALGADRDTLKYIIASPFDNWYVNLGAGVQTFIGNELDASARHNKLNFNGRIEVGKWLIPDVAVSLRITAFNVDGQSQYGKQPFINKFEDTPNENGYYPFHAHAAAALGFVTLDWTNFLNGYEKGKRTRLHVSTPIGLGMSMLYGSQRNPTTDYAIGAFRRNFELAFDAGIGFEYVISPDFAMNATAELFGSESTWDWSPYDNSYSIFDIIPSFSIGAKFNLLESVVKYDIYSQEAHREKVNHEFLAYGSSHTVTDLKERIEDLIVKIDSIQNLADNRSAQDAAMLGELQNSLDNLQAELDSVQREAPTPHNIIEELLDANGVLNLPATIVYYQLDKYDIDYNGCKKLQIFAKEISQLDDTIEYFIIGAADSLTGSRRHNDWLSERRCEAAYNFLVEHCDASGNQFILVPVGGINVYDPKEYNRIALIIQRSPVTEEIVNRWMRYGW